MTLGPCLRHQGLGRSGSRQLLDGFDGLVSVTGPVSFSIGYVRQMTATWTLAVARADLARTTLVDGTVPELAPGEALLRVDRVGLTANNVTYAVLGEAFHYWDFFPAQPRGLAADWGLVPLWGFADIVESTVDGVDVGGRVYGYLPPAGHLVVRPGRVDAGGFRDATEHRALLPSPYNVYALTTGDSAYEAQREDLLILYRPLFFTSFMLADQVADNDFFGAEVLVLSSASSKTAYGTAFLLHGQGPRVIGLTSAGNAAFTRSLGCYDEVLSYDTVSELDPDRLTAFLDLAGNERIRTAVHERLGDYLVYEVAVGITHQDARLMGGASVFFAPDQMRKRALDWGREGLNDRFGAAWRQFASTVEAWVDVVVSHGPEALREAWLKVLTGRASPRTGHVVAL